MEIRLSAHGAYHHQNHVVRIPEFRKKILNGELKEYIEKRLFDIQEYHPDIEIEKYGYIRVSQRSKPLIGLPHSKYHDFFLIKNHPKSDQE